MGVLIALLTGSALCAALAAAFAWMARSASERAEHSEARLLLQRGRIVALESALDALDVKVRKLNGRLSAQHRWEPDDAPPPAPRPTGAECENWGIAQAEGPSSAAAHCQCAYCDGRRRARDGLRATMVPPTRAKLGVAK